MLRREPVKVQRDRWGRPIVDGRAYTRASTLAKTLDETSALAAWKTRMAIVGVARNPDLHALAATTDPQDRRALNEIAERAAERAGATSGRDLGTSIHSASELVDAGLPTGHLPAPVLADALAYAAASRAEGLTPVAAETFVAHEQLGVAGSFDRLMSSPDGFVIGDIKTGSNPDLGRVLAYSGLAWATQLAAYANSTPWDGGWSSWEAVGGAPSTSRGVIFYVPRGSGRCHPVWLDLEVGWRAACLSVQVREIRKVKVTL